MPQFLITYDLKSTTPDPHKPFLSAAEKQGLLYVWKSPNYVNRLPNTTVWGVFKDKDAAKAAFNAAIAAAANKTTITVEKVFIARFDGTYCDSDVYKQPEAKWTGTTDFETCRQHQLNDPVFK